MTPGRTILHMDMNAFFASVEQQADPALRNRPVAVIGSAKRTVITTASYEARAFGVKTGMTVYEGRRLCPDIVFVVGKNRRYAAVSTRIMEILREFTPLVEVFSIDEAFMDVTGSIALFGPPERIAGMVKERILEAEGLTCSIGIAPNKLLAKLASDMQKPDGLTVIRASDVAEVLEKVPIRDMCGVGRKTETALAAFGIRSCGDLGRFPLELLTRKFGVMGERLSLMGRGIDNSPVVPSEEAEEVKSVGHSSTLAADITGREEMLKQILRLSEMVGRRARRYGIRGKTVTLTVRYADFTTFSRQAALPDYTNLSGDIYKKAVEILDAIPLSQPVRLLGVRITSLDCDGGQLSLFGSDERKAKAAAAMDMANSRFGDFTVTYGTLLDGEERGAEVISPAWRPAGVRRVEVE